VVPFLALVALLAVQSVSAGRASIRSVTVEAARFRAADVDALIESWRQTLDALAHTPSVRERRVDETNQILEELLQAYPYLMNVSAVDDELFIWAAAQPRNRGQRITGPQSERARLVLERGQTDVSERVALAPEPGRPARLVFIRHPIRDRAGQVVGLLQLGLPLETLNAALRLDTAAPDHPVAVVHADGTLLTSSGADQVWSGGDGSGVPGSLVTQVPSGVVDVRDTDGGEWLVAYQRADSLPWYALVAAAGRFATRDFAHRVRLGESCELDRVAAAFNQMAAQLRSAYEDLEARVRERTTELDAARRELESVNAGLQSTVERQVEQLERTNQLKRYLSPRVAELLVSERAEVGTRIRRRELSMLFTDVRGFTSLTEDVEPEDLVELLNAFLTEITQAVFDEGGTPDKYLGDGLMAFFGDPIPYADHADRAVRAALPMRERLTRVQQRWFTLGQRPLSIGVGIASGFVTVGAIGSPERLEYTVIGNNVNLAARLVGVAEPGEILCNARTAASVERWALVRERGPATIRGRARPVNVFEIAGVRAANGATVELFADRA
jgi:class 3 adenylate cyclase